MVKIAETAKNIPNTKIGMLGNVNKIPVIPIKTIPAIIPKMLSRDSKCTCII